MIKDEMPCFDPQDAIFLTNKLNNVKNVCYEDENDCEDEATETWRSLKDKIKESWTEVKEENIFKIDLQNVMDFLRVFFIQILIKLRNAIAVRCASVVTNAFLIKVFLKKMCALLFKKNQKPPFDL